jgi:hypothetical protein
MTLKVDQRRRRCASRRFAVGRDSLFRKESPGLATWREKRMPIEFILTHGRSQLRYCTVIQRLFHSFDLLLQADIFIDSVIDGNIRDNSTRRTA